VLTPRSSHRLGTAFAIAANEIRDGLTQGRRLRTDDFFNQGERRRADADELLEGVLLLASDSYEEHKVPCFGRLYASIAFDGTVSVGEAQYWLRLLERFSYRQLLILSVFPIKGDWRELPSRLDGFSDDFDELARERLLCQDNFEDGVVELRNPSETPPGSILHTEKAMRFKRLFGADRLPLADRRQTLRVLGLPLQARVDLV
jgi:hypothetical protein